ncbi:MAG: asparaginase [Methylobacteriaceae bacterium]|nr:asparaginase [Methylobacteriaceae bacterium]MBV9636674.1 asparaginase [Methylobacteriaceae bacterium]
MENPILVEVLRGSQIESRHRGAMAVSDPDGKLVLALGDVEGRVFPRSAVKGLQAIPLVESGIADRLGLTEAELALACASHSGEPVHVAAAAAMLGKAGRDSGCLECGSHWPLNEAAAHSLAAGGGTPSALHNNCSGKHAGFICLSCGLGADPKHYVQPDHIVQREVTAALESLVGMTLADDVRAIDGCSIPTYAVPLAALAHAFARFATGEGLAPKRAAAARRLRAAVAAHPHMVAGTGRFDTAVMEVLRERAFTKTGAEGVFCAALPPSRLGVAIKCEDGAGRAAEAVMAAVLKRFVTLSGEDEERLAPRLAPRLKNWNGLEVGRVRVTPVLTAPDCR